MRKSISVAALRGRLDKALENEAELAVLDVREAGQYAAGHLFFATHAPHSRLESEIAGFVPRPETPVVVYDAGDGVADMAAAALAGVGYSDVAVMEGGAPAWADAGHTLYEGVNLPSKTFGELVERELDTPRLSADDLAAMQEKGGDFIILDGRTPEEYAGFNIPGGISCPNAELPLRFDDLVPGPATTVVINCAGRTRSIIGAQTLINFRVANRVVALENGTQGWALSDRQLEHGAKRFPPSGITAPALERARSRADDVAERFGVSFIDHEELAAWRADGARTLYLLDVRRRAEFDAGHLPGSRHAPGGQLVQATDRWLGARGARVVVCDDTEVRAICAAHWLKQMGWDVRVLKGGVGDGAAETGSGAAAGPALSAISAEDLTSLLAGGGATVIDLRSSRDFEDGHIPGAVWAIRPRLRASDVPAGRPVVLVADDPAAARLVAEDLDRAGIHDVRRLAGGMAAWTDGEGEIAAPPSRTPPSDRIDFAAFTAERHGGNKDHMRQYLEWEINLVNQLDDQERSAFAVQTP